MKSGSRGGAVARLGRPPLRARDLTRERITPLEGLPALSLDALTSVAYGPEAVIVVLAVAGAGALHLVLPITIAIVALLAILVFSYRQVIDAYPGGGGAYAVSRANLGSRCQPGRRGRAGRRLHPHGRGFHRRRGRLAGVGLPRPDLGYGADLPGHPGRDHGAQPARPWRCGPGVPAAHDGVHRRVAGHHRHRARPPPGSCTPPSPAARCSRPWPGQVVRVLLVLKAFSAGCSALTGVEAIANGVPPSSSPAPSGPSAPRCSWGSSSARCCSGSPPRKPLAHGPRSEQTVLAGMHGAGRRAALGVLRDLVHYHRGARARRQHVLTGGLPVLGQPPRAGQLPAAPVPAPGRPAGLGYGVWMLAVHVRRACSSWSGATLSA